MKKRIIIEVEFEKPKRCSKEKIDTFFEFEFNGLDPYECEDVYLDDVDIDYEITNCKVEDL